MNKPALVIVPPDAVQVTAVLLVPVTVAVNCWLPPVAICWAGETATVTGPEVEEVEELVAAEFDAVVPQPDKVIRTAMPMAIRTGCFTRSFSPGKFLPQRLLILTTLSTLMLAFRGQA